jgi:hypothetical protein
MDNMRSDFFQGKMDKVLFHWPNRYEDKQLSMQEVQDISHRK